MPGQRMSRSHLPLISMPQRCSVLHGIEIRDQDGYQARVFCNLTRSKSEPKSALFEGCASRNNLMPGRRVFRSHWPLIVMPQRCSVLHGIGIGDQDGCQARVFCNPTHKTKISAQIGNFWRVRLQKQPDAWSEGVPLPLAFDCYATKVLCPPWYWNRGPGWLSSQGVLQSSNETKI